MAVVLSAKCDPQPSGVRQWSKTRAAPLYSLFVVYLWGKRYVGEPKPGGGREGRFNGVVTTAKHQTPHVLADTSVI